MARKRPDGNYCWACDRRRANEKFSGRNRGRHLCKDCARLGKAELAYRQAIRNVEQCVTWEGFVRRKRRRQFRKYLGHDNERVRSFAHEIEIADAVKRAEDRAGDDWDDLFYELAEEGIFLMEAGSYAELDFKDLREIQSNMAITCPKCGAEFDATLFEFGHGVRCDCGAEIEYPGTGLPTGHVVLQGDRPPSHEDRCVGRIENGLHGRDEIVALTQHLSPLDIREA